MKVADLFPHSNDPAAALSAWGAAEIIDGVNLDDAEKDVDLDIECSPVLFSRLSVDPAKASRLEDGGFRVHFDNMVQEVDPDRMRRMRARYLLKRGEILRALPSLGPADREVIEAQWFGGNAFVPAEGSALRHVFDTGTPLSIALREGQDTLDVISGLFREAGAENVQIVKLTPPPKTTEAGAETVPVSVPAPEPGSFVALEPVQLPPQGSLHLLAVDVPALRRIWYGLAPKKKQHLAYGLVMRELARMLRARQPSHVIFAFEGNGSIREAESPEYKASRKPSPEALVDYEMSVQRALRESGAPVWAPDGYEADDAIAAAVRFGRDAGLPCVIASPDKDLGQLVDDAAGVMLWDRHEEVTSAATIREKWGVLPNRLGDLLALAGDSGDGITGIPKWGKAKAAEVLTSASVNGRPLAALLRPGGSWWLPGKTKKAFDANAEKVRTYRELMRLRDECLPGVPLCFLAVDPLELADKILARGDDDE